MFVLCACLRQGLPALVLHEIQLLKDSHHSETEEEKISSSSLRSRLLGTLLSPPVVSCILIEHFNQGDLKKDIFCIHFNNNEIFFLF